MDSDQEDFVFYGTPIEREEDLTSRRKKSVAEASGLLRTLPAWKQEVRDEEGRRRFHGAFTGGFSAGYFNTVGSKEGWTPQTFTSSRKNRAEVKQQSILNFLDEDERAEMEGRSLGTSSQFDTFGFTAAEIARKQADKEQQKRPSAIPGPVPDEIVLPATESIGVKLLLKMGWRHGHSIKESGADSLYNTRREARKAFLAFSSDGAKAEPGGSEGGEDNLGNLLEKPFNDDVHSSQTTPVHILKPKQDVYGLGYDPYKHAPEFREAKRSRGPANRESRNRKSLSMKESLFGFKSGKAAPGFGIGALEEYDAEDEDLYGSAYDFEETYVQDDEELSKSTTDPKQKLVWKEHEGLFGFRVASNPDYQLERFDPPVIPKDFVPHHKFPTPLEAANKLTCPPPPDVPPPEDSNLKLLIEGVATLVARCGKLFEDLSREKNQSNPLFSFLVGGKGHDYYERKVWEGQQKHNDQKKLILDGRSSPSVQKMTAATRGKLLGERPLERSSTEVSLSDASVNVNLQFHLSDTFTKPECSRELSELAKPFKDDPPKQERFERFLREKYQGGLRSTDAGGASNMSEAARARERLDFEAAVEAIEKGKLSKEGNLLKSQLLEFSGGGGMQFTTGGLEQAKDTQPEELMPNKSYPKREEFQWRPSAVLCKRFDLVDPYMGKPPPPPRVRSRIDSLIFTSDSVKSSKVEEAVRQSPEKFLALQSDVKEIGKGVAIEETEVEVQVENVERPVDLYKAIFSDDSDDEVEVSSSVKKAEDPEKKIDVAHTALNRLIAGDFLESLGKELGLEVPPETPYSTSEVKSVAPQKEIKISTDTKTTLLPVKNAYDIASTNQGVMSQQEAARKGSEVQKTDTTQGKILDDSSKTKVHGVYDNGSGKVDLGMIAQEDGKNNSAASRHRKRSCSTSSEDDRTRKHSRRHRYRSSDSYSDSSSDHRDRHHSRSKGRTKGSSRQKRSTSSRKHSKHHKHGNRESHSRSHYSTERISRR